MIREKVNKIYDRDNMCLPTGLCNPCRLKLERPYVCKKYPNYSKIFSNGSLRWTRERQDKEDQCNCKICVVSSANSYAYKKMVKKWKGEIMENVCCFRKLYLKKASVGFIIHKTGLEVD